MSRKDFSRRLPQGMGNCTQGNTSPDGRNVGQRMAGTAAVAVKNIFVYVRNRSAKLAYIPNEILGTKDLFKLLAGDVQDCD